MQVLKTILRYLLGLFFVVAGLNHFITPGFYLPIMPDYLPWHEALVFLSGVAEVAAGILLCVPKTQRIGAWAIIAVLVAVFPANIHMAMNPENFSDYGSPTALYIRLPLQLIPLFWAWCYTGTAPSQTTR